LGLEGSLLEHLIDPARSRPDDPLNRIAGFVDGFLWAKEDHLGQADPLADELFHWLIQERGERSSAGWWTRLAAECGGDQVAAVRKLRDLIVELLRRKGELT